MGIAARKEREKEQHKEEILNAAEQVFFEKGLAQATMEEIALRAEFSKGTLYLYYKSKEDLCMAVICRGHQILFTMFQEAAATREPTVQLLENIGQAYYSFYKRYHNYFRMFAFSENTPLHSQVSEEMSDACAESSQKICRLVLDVIQRGKEEGTFRKEVDPFEFGVIFWSGARGIMRLMDQANLDHKCAKEFSKLNVEQLLAKSNSMLIYAILSDEARQHYQLKL